MRMPYAGHASWYGGRRQGDETLQAVLRGLERPLLATSVHVEAEAGALEIPEAAVMMDQFAGRGLDFVVDCGTRVRSPNVAQLNTAGTPP